MWLINHEKLAEWEIPLLAESGFENIYTPQKYPNIPSYTSGGIVKPRITSSEIQEDLEELNAQNWYSEISSKSSEIINRHFEVIFVAAELSQIMRIVKSFYGRIVIRLFGLVGSRSYGELFEFGLSPSELKLFKKNLYRITFGLGYKELVQGEPDWIRNHIIFLPIGVPQTKGIPWVGNSEHVVSVIGRIEPGSYYEKALQDHLRIAKNLNIKILGRQHIVFEDPKILGALNQAEVNTEFSSARCMLYASKEKKHVHYHPLEAMQIGLPVIYFKNTLLDGILGGDLEGGVSTETEASGLLLELVTNHEKAKLMGLAQQERISLLERQHLSKDFIDGIKLLTKPLEIRNQEEWRIGVFCESNHPECINIEYDGKLNSQILLSRDLTKTFISETKIVTLAFK